MPLSPREYLYPIHDYFGVDLDIVWDVVVNKIPILRQAIQRIIEAENGQEAPS